MSDILRRSIATALEQVDANTLSARIVPFNVNATVVDKLADGTLDRYSEAFADTAFDRQLKAAENMGRIFQRVALVDEHQGSKLGFATLLEKKPDGLHAELRLLPSRTGDVQALMDGGVDNMSIEFIALRGGTRRLSDGTRLRTDAHLVRVALVAEGAYKGAEVLAMRDAEDIAASADREYEAQMAELDAFMADALERQQHWNERITT